MMSRRATTWLVAAGVLSVAAAACRAPHEAGSQAGAGPVASATAAATTTAATAATTTASATGAPVPVTEVPVQTARTLPDTVRNFRADRAFATVALPLAVRVPAIDVASPLELLGRAPDGAIEVPSWQRAGWYADGPRPGQDGPAVILGHVDSPRGPAVFARLAELAPGDEVIVERADGTSARFLVERLERHPKDSFPTEAVYGASLEPTLHLVTCGGAFDRSTGHYRDNVIAFATLAR
jgi:hypothetical protein